MRETREKIPIRALGMSNLLRYEIIYGSTSIEGDVFLDDRIVHR